MKKGFRLLAESVKACEVETFFFLEGGPMVDAMQESMAVGVGGIGMRDERAAAFAAIAYSRVSQRPGVVMTGAGGDMTNTITGLSHAHVDGAPVVLLSGSAPLDGRGKGSFQETDQVSLMRPITKWAQQVQAVDRIPDTVLTAFQVCRNGSPGPVYLDFPSDILYGDSDVSVDARIGSGQLDRAKSLGDPNLIAEAVQLLEQAHKPIIIAGSGVLWATAWSELKDFVEASGVPIFTTPIARGLIAEDHPLCPTSARSTAFKEADCIFVIGTRTNYVINWLQPPVINAECRIIQLNINPDDLFRNRLADVAILADAKLALPQLTAEVRQRVTSGQYADWTNHLHAVHTEGQAKMLAVEDLDSIPIHPQRLCTELHQVLPRDAIVANDGHEIAWFSRRGITAYLPGHTLTPGAYGTMGVGVPFGIGAKIAKPDMPVLVLTGDGAFGYHAMELDTAVRHHLGIVVVISNNGGWTGARDWTAGRWLGFTDYHRLADVFGIWGAKVTEPSEIQPALNEAFKYAERERKPAIVNVITSPAQNQGREFVNYRSA